MRAWFFVFFKIYMPSITGQGGMYSVYMVWQCTHQIYTMNKQCPWKTVILVFKTTLAIRGLFCKTWAISANWALLMMTVRSSINIIPNNHHYYLASHFWSSHGIMIILPLHYYDLTILSLLIPSFVFLVVTSHYYKYYPNVVFSVHYFVKFTRTLR